jgi:uncharacterized DUF497 family protein
MNDSPVAGFDWDEGNEGKCGKHGIARVEIEAVFRHPHRVTPDLAHSTVETRFLAIGEGDGPRAILVAFTLRERDGERLIRPISARHMHRKEIEHYEKAIAQTGE